MMTKKTKRNIVRACAYVVLGSIVFIASVFFGMYMYFSGTFLPGMHVARYTLYAITFAMILIYSFFYKKSNFYYKYLYCEEWNFFERK